MFSRFSYVLAEYAHRKVEGSARGIDADGKDIAIGTFGSYLERRNEERFNEVSYKFSQTSMGSSLLGYLHDRHVDATVDHRREQGAVYMPGRKDIWLTPNAKDDFLIGYLAHEIRHAHQHEKLQKLFGTGNMPPEAEIVINRFVEADAHAFQRKFCEDYAEKTGDRGPLRAAEAAHEKAFPGINAKLAKANTDAEKFMVWNEALCDSSYDADTISFLQRKLDERDANASFKKAMISPEATDKLIIAAARQIDTDWPLIPKDGKPKHYLSNISDQQLTSPAMKKAPSFGDMGKLTTDYAASYASKNPQISARMGIMSGAPPSPPPAPAAR